MPGRQGISTRSAASAAASAASVACGAVSMSASQRPLPWLLPVHVEAERMEPVPPRAFPRDGCLSTPRRSLGIEVNDDGGLSCPLGGDGQMQGQRGFPGAAFLA